MTAKQLLDAALKRKCVTGFHRLNPEARIPAAFLQNMPFVVIYHVLKRLKIYKRKK